jgi:hypothetical protein
MAHNDDIDENWISFFNMQEYRANKSREATERPTRTAKWSRAVNQSMMMVKIMNMGKYLVSVLWKQMGRTWGRDLPVRRTLFSWFDGQVERLASEPISTKVVGMRGSARCQATTGLDEAALSDGA